MSDQPLCEARGVTHEFTSPGGQPLRVLEDISLTIRPDEVVALLGPSGCGKSTLLRILAGLVRPTAGEVLYHGRPLDGLNPGVALVFQSFALYPWLTVAENIEVVLRARGLPEAEVRDRARDVVRLVGLANFADACPRELSGGMKQRVGMARALAVQPEVLFMDEPFSHVDALTAESLRAEVLDLWVARKHGLSSILLVSHDIKEVAFMADRIVLLSANPGRVRAVLEDRLPRPRDYRAPPLLALVDRLHEAITGHELPDAVPAGAEEELEPLPAVSVSEVVGLLEYLDARGGKQDLFHIAGDTHREFGQVIAVVKAAEMLELVDTPRSLVLLDQEGQRFVQAGLDQRKVLWRERLLALRLFREVRALLQRQPGHALPRDTVQDVLVLRLPQEPSDRLFRTLVRWGRFGGLFRYDEKKGMLSLIENGPTGQ